MGKIHIISIGLAVIGLGLIFSGVATGTIWISLLGLPFLISIWVLQLFFNK